MATTLDAGGAVMFTGTLMPMMLMVMVKVGGAPAEVALADSAAARPLPWCSAPPSLTPRPGHDGSAPGHARRGATPAGCRT
jgi:hypothetical protein